MSETLLKLLSLTEMWLGAGLGGVSGDFLGASRPPVGQAVPLEDDEDARAAGIATASSPR